jgi:hypothetical protein
MLSLRFETSAPDSLFLALFLRRLPASIRDHLAAANHATATHTDVLWDARNTASVSAVSDSIAAMSVRSASPDRRAKSLDRRARSAERRCDNSRPSDPHLAAGITRNSATTTGLTDLRHLNARVHASGRKTGPPPPAAQRPRRPHFSSGFGVQTAISCRYRGRCLSVSTQVFCCLFRSTVVWG